MSTGNERDNLLAKKWEKEQLSFTAFAASRHIPLGGTFELTPRCSLKCKMCYVRLDKCQIDTIGRELTTDEWIEMGREAIKAGTVNLLITGGEPLIRKDFAEIYTALSTMGFIITLNTNATLITPEIIKLFSKYPPTATAVTLYGASGATYEKICGDGSAFDKTIRGLEALAKVPTELEVRTTFIQDNMNDLNELRNIANRYTSRFAINVNVFKAIRGAVSDAENCRMSPSQINDLILANKAYYDELNKRLEMDKNSGEETGGQAQNNKDTVPAQEVDIFSSEEKITSGKDFAHNLAPTILTCLAAKGFYWITWDGKMLPCGCFSNPYTLPLEEGFLTAWNRLPGLLEDIRKPKECLRCELNDGKCNNCIAKLHAETGRFDKISHYICSVAKERQKLASELDQPL